MFEAAEVQVGGAVVGIDRVGDRAGEDRVDDRRGQAVLVVEGDAAVVVALGIVGDHAKVEGVDRREQQLPAQGVDVLVVLVGNVRRRRLHHGHVAVALPHRPIEPTGQDARHDRTVDRDRAAVPAVVLHRPLRLGARREGWGHGGDRDDPGDGVLAEEGALRPLQDLDVREFAQVVEADAVARAIDPVDVETDALLQAGIVGDIADPADADDRRRLAGVGVHRQTRCERRQVRHRPHLGVLQLLLVQHGDHDRHVLKPLLALLRGDDDFGHGPARLTGVSRSGTGSALRQCAARANQRRGARQQAHAPDADGFVEQSHKASPP